MKIYLISQTANRGYDTYDSAIVVAKDVEAAKRMNPGGFREWSDNEEGWMFIYFDGKKSPDKDDTWVEHIDQVKVECIGEANADMQAGVVLASFHAG